MKSMSSMKKMQVIQPKIKKLQEQYKDNPAMVRTFETLDRNPLGDVLMVRMNEGGVYSALLVHIKALDTDQIIEDQFFQDYALT